MSITLDAETTSYADLVKVGPWSYSEHSTTNIVCICYAFGGSAVREWWLHMTDGKMPADLAKAVAEGATLERSSREMAGDCWQHSTSRAAATKGVWRDIFRYRMPGTSGARGGLADLRTP